MDGGVKRNDGHMRKEFSRLQDIDIKCNPLTATERRMFSALGTLQIDLQLWQLRIGGYARVSTCVYRHVAIKHQVQTRTCITTVFRQETAQMLILEYPGYTRRYLT